MDMQGVKRISNLMSYTGREQSEGLNPLSLDRLEGFLPRFSGVVQD
jgi:hypothetical protein